MEHSKVRLKTRVVPHSKTADGHGQGLSNSLAWREAELKGQPFLYVTSKRPNGDYPECLLSVNQMDKMEGDFFLSSDFELFRTDKTTAKKRR